MAKKLQRVTKKQEREARAIVERAIKQQRAKDVAEKRLLLGRCYKYPNRYSDGEQWWLYAIVTRVDEHGCLTTAQFQHDALGNVSIQPDQYGGLLPHGGWIEIPRHEFNIGVAEVAQAFLQKMGSALSADARPTDSEPGKA